MSQSTWGSVQLIIYVIVELMRRLHCICSWKSENCTGPFVDLQRHWWLSTRAMLGRCNIESLSTQSWHHFFSSSEAGSLKYSVSAVQAASASVQELFSYCFISDFQYLQFHNFSLFLFALIISGMFIVQALIIQ